MINTKIVIVGAGFGGLSAALNLRKVFKNDKSVKIILADCRNYHLFTPNLFEVATAEEELTSIQQLKKSTALPIAEILQGSDIEFIQGKLEQIEPINKKIKIGVKDLSFDYLVLAIGLSADFGQMEGAKEYALPLGSLPDALRIRNAAEFAVQSRGMEVKKKLLRFIVAGGGSAAVEFAAELKKMLNFVAWKYGFPEEKIEIALLESRGELLNGINGNLSKDISVRLRELGIRVEFNSQIIRADRHLVELLNGEKTEYDLLVWTGKGKGSAEIFGNNFLLDMKGRIKVGENLQAIGHDRIFAIGNIASVFNGKTDFIEGSYQNAVEQGKYIACALPKLMQNFYFKGFFAYMINLYRHFKYYRSLVGFKKAFKYVWFQNMLYGRND
ncbi:MAG: FAD-dependent oxidoreductase [Candidatus Doudnabacteria bacterium]|nr:FAD-dependent oxidoreductase [Candidatus Doudnabacteria bacterium]